MDNYAMGGGNLLTGLMSGFAKGRNDKLNREMMDKQIKMAQAQAKIKQAENVQKQEAWTRKMAQEDRVNAAREAFFTAYGIPSPTGQPQGQVAGQGQSQDIAKTQQPQGGILDAMTSGPPSLGFGFPGQPQQSDRTFLSGGNEGSPQPQGQPQLPGQPQSPPQRSLTELLSNPGALMALQESTGINLIPIANMITNQGKLKQTIANETADNTREDLKFGETKRSNRAGESLSLSKFTETQNQNKLAAEEVTWKPVVEEGVEYEIPYDKYGKKIEGAEKRFVKITPEKLKVDKAKVRLSKQLSGLGSMYAELGKTGGIINTDKSSWDNLWAGAKSSSMGQAIMTKLGNKEQSLRNVINAIKPSLIQALRQATEMGVRGMDSEKELQFYLQAVSNEKVDIQANMAAIAILDEAFGTGTVIDNLKTNESAGVLQRVTELRTTWAAMDNADVKGGLPSEAVAKLKEGQKITFGNGQTWTLKDGEPMQVQ